MVHFCCIGLLVIFSVVQNVHSLFTDSVENIIKTNGSLTCQSSSFGRRNDFHLCAIRFYTTNVTGESQIVTFQDGMWFTNTFRQLIKTRNCTGFRDSMDIGSGTCDVMPYESAQTMTLCICATNDCNTDLKTCQSSSDTTENILPLPIIISDLTTNIECYNIEIEDPDCSPSSTPKFIDAAACNDYIRNHSVMCEITGDSERSFYRALIKENYQGILTDKLHDLKLLGSWDKLIQADTNIYVQYTIANITVEQCGCTQNSLCNYNINTCSPNTTQTETTNSWTSPSAFVTNSISESITFTTAVTMESVTSVTATINSTSSTPVVTSLSDITTVTIDTSTANNSVSSFTSSVTEITKDVNTENTASMTQSATTVNTASTTNSPTENGTGLSRGAIAGIVVGAVVVGFSLISVVFYKCLAGKVHSPFGRSSAYLA